jgi:murein DD-endopeptidase
MNCCPLVFLTLVLLQGVIARGVQASSQGQPENAAPVVLPKVDLGVRVALDVPIAPTPVPIGDHVDLVYELHLCSYDDRRLILQRVEILADTLQHTVATFENDSLTRILGAGEPDSDLAAHAIAARNQIVLYFWIPSHPGNIPSRLSHRLTFDTGSKREVVEGGKAEIARRPPVTIGPPLRSGYWVASNSGNETLHRRLIITPEQKPVIGTRFATDWWKKGENGSMNREHTPLRNEDFYCYGEEVVAVADATVASLVDGIPENQPGLVPPDSDLRTITGNRVILNLGGNAFAIYAHLQPGSIRVKQGQRVQRGEPLALVGNSGLSDAPHLHFQVADADGLAGEGLPYVLDGYAGFGVSISGKPVDASQHRLVHGRFPATDETVSFLTK